VTLGRRALATLAVVLVIGGLVSGSPSPGPDDADIVIERATLRDGPHGQVLDVRAEVQLPIAVRRGLDSGVPLDFLVELSVMRPRTWLPDRRVGGDRWSYRLVYYELTRHYRLGTRDGTAARNYRSLLDALEGLGDLRGLPVTDPGTGSGTDIGTGAGGDVRPALANGGTAAAAGRARGNGLRATLTMRLDARALPLPLQPLIGTSWRLRAAPYTWRIEA